MPNLQWCALCVIETGIYQALPLALLVLVLVLVMLLLVQVLLPSLPLQALPSNC